MASGPASLRYRGVSFPLKEDEILREHVSLDVMICTCTGGVTAHTLENKIILWRLEADESACQTNSMLASLTDCELEI